METTTIQIDVEDANILNMMKHKEGYKSLAFLIKDIMKVIRKFQPELKEEKK